MSDSFANPAGCDTALYVHVPFCVAKCRYCAFYSEALAGRDADRLISAMLRELDNYGPIDSVRTVYVGGGSPTALPAGDLTRLVARIAARCPDSREFTVECNPGQTSEHLLSQLRGLGVNRLSIGAQSFVADELEFLGRSHSSAAAARSVMDARRAGFDNVGLDLIFAIPGSTMQSWQYSLDSATGLGVEHISAYSLSYESGTPLKAALDAGDIVRVDEDTDRAMYELAVRRLAESGLKQYEISNFAADGFQCLHNMTYWRNDPYIGIGPGAASYRHNRRTAGVADIDAYTEAVENDRSPIVEVDEPNRLERACQTAALNLRMRSGIDLGQFKQRTGLDAAEYFAEPIEKYERLGLLEQRAGRVFLTQEALPIADSVLCDFMIS